MTVTLEVTVTCVTGTFSTPTDTLQSPWAACPARPGDPEQTGYRSAPSESALAADPPDPVDDDVPVEGVEAVETPIESDAGVDATADPFADDPTDVSQVPLDEVSTIDGSIDTDDLLLAEPGDAVLGDG